jgi:restriction system protein
MSVPDYQALMLPLLKALEDGAEHAVRDVREQVARKLGLTEEDRALMLPSGKQPLYENRFGWAKTYLDKAGLLQTVRRGVYVITERGQQLLASKPKAINNDSLSQFSEFQEFMLGRTGPKDKESEGGGKSEVVPSDITPQEALEAAYRDLRRKTELELLNAIMNASPQFFERLVVELLVKMGYGGSLEEAGKAIGRSHDGGLDGMIKEDHLGLDAIYIQAKRWKDTVGRPEIQAFAGSLEGERARKGVFITASTFSAEARQYVARIEKKIVLIDGAQLAGLMFDFGIGVNPVNTYEVKRVDTDYFSEE